MQIASGLPRQISSVYRYRLVAFAIAQRSRQRFRLRRRRLPQPPTAAAEADYPQHHPAHSSLDGIPRPARRISPDAKPSYSKPSPKRRPGRERLPDLYAGAWVQSPRMVSTGKGACTCAYYRPDGKKIILASSHLDPKVDEPKPPKKGRGYEWDFNEHMDIFEADPDGSNLKRSPTPRLRRRRPYSPDGSSSFTSMRDGDQEIYVMNADGTDQLPDLRQGLRRRTVLLARWKSIVYRGDRRGDDK